MEMNLSNRLASLWGRMHAKASKCGEKRLELGRKFVMLLRYHCVRGQEGYEEQGRALGCA